MTYCQEVFFSSALDAASKAEEKKTSWQYVIVYKIIADGMKGEWNGLTLDEIRRRYATEVAAVKDIDVGRPDLQEMAIRKVVLGLIESQLVYNTIDDRYVIQG